MKRSIAIGCDPNAMALKDALVRYLESRDYSVDDYGSDDPIYANTALNVSTAIVSGKHSRAILLCGTGLGMCLAANKVPGAYAVTCSDEYSVERSILSNNANILTMGAKVVSIEKAIRLVDIWLNAEYEPGGPSQPKVDMIYEIEKKFTVH